jgi:hypothetical protein
MKPEIHRRRIRNQVSRRNLVSGLLASLTLGITLAAGVVTLTRAGSANAAAPDAPAADCGVVSCTTYLPAVFKNFPPPSNLEVTQGVQQPNNSVLLIENRATFVRYTLTSTTAYAGVSAWLYGTRNGSPLPGSPIAALNNPRTLKATANRAVLNDTFNFQLPASWLNGTVVLSASATNGSTFSEAGGPETITFLQAAPLDVTIVPIAYTCNSGGSGTTTPAAPYAYLTDYTYRTYPVPSVVTTTHAAVGYSGPCASGVPDPAYNDWNNILSTVSSVWTSEGSPNSYYYGLLKVSCGGGCIAGIGWIGSPSAVGFDGFGASHSGASVTHAHEVGHNHGRFHAPGCGAAGPDPSFPYVSGGVGYIGNSANPNYGFDIKSQAIYAYTNHIDFMSYCGPEWVSDYTYEALYNYAQVYGASSLRMTPGNRALLVSGSIDLSSDKVTFRPVFALDTPGRLPEPGDYTLELLDASGRAIVSYSFAPATAHADRLRGGSAFEHTGFHLALPYADGVAAIQVRRAGAILGVLKSGAREPSLRADVSALDADRQSWRVTWSDAEADGDSLHYLVRASTDDGATWQTIGVGLTSPTIDLNPIDFAGQDVRVEVIASDGLNSTQLQLGPFAMP